MDPTLVHRQIESTTGGGKLFHVQYFAPKEQYLTSDKIKLVIGTANEMKKLREMVMRTGVRKQMRKRRRK